MKNTEEKTLYRSSTDKMIFGVCGGMAQYFDKDALFFRLLAAAVILFVPFGLFIYLFAAIFIPMEPKEEETTKTGEEDIAEPTVFESEIVEEE